MEEDIKILKEIKEEYDYAFGTKIYRPHSISREEIQAIENILNRLEQLEKDFEIIQHEHDRLDKINNELLKKNEHYKYLMYALETYYNITEEDLQKCIKEDC